MDHRSRSILIGPLKIFGLHSGRFHTQLKILPNVILVLEFETLKSNNFIQYVESLWFFERLQKFIDQKEINYTDHKVFCDILLTGLHLVNVNRFEQE